MVFKIPYFSHNQLRFNHQYLTKEVSLETEQLRCKKRVLVACEYSGTVRDAFAAKGWDAWSCDLLPTDKPGQHYQGDIKEMLKQKWDLLIAHPPCTYLTVSGNKWFKPEFAAKYPTRHQDREDGAAFFMLFANADVPHIAIENPIGVMSTRYRKPSQVVQPHQYGHPCTKATCLWLKGLPNLVPTNDVKEHMLTLSIKEQQWMHYLPPSADRWKIRSKTFDGIAQAMATQWTNFIDSQ